MKRHTQTTGVRQWAGGDLVDLQAEPLQVLDAYFEEYGPCVIRGCAVITSGSDKNITPGLVALRGVDHDGKATFKVVPFAGVENVTLPVYLTLSFTVVERAYTDRKVKPIAYNYTAIASLVKPVAGIPYLEITSGGGNRFVDAAGISSRLERTGDGKDVSVSFSPAANRVNVSTGEKLSTLFGKVSRWFTDLKAVAFSGKAVDITEDTTHRFMTDTERTKLDGVETGANKYIHPASHPADMITDAAEKVIMTKVERDKLAGVAAGANAYVHPANHPATVISEDATHRFVTDAEKQGWKGKAEGNHNHAGVYQPAGSYSVTGHGHNATEITPDATHRFVTDAEKQGWSGKAEGNHNHAGVYQPAGSYSVTGHGHNATEITPDATHRFVTDVEKQGWSGKAEGNHDHKTLYAGINHDHDTTYAPKSHNHAGVYQPAGSYSVTGHGHAAAEITPDATHRFVTDAEKQGWGGKAEGNHNHAGVYQPVGSYSPAGHGHNASEITQDTIRRFVTDAEKATWNGKIEFYCAGLITGSASKEGYWGGGFTVFKSSTGYYRVKHELNRACQVLAMCINASGQEGFASIPYRSNTDFYVSTSGTSGRQDMSFFFMVFTL